MAAAGSAGGRGRRAAGRRAGGHRAGRCAAATAAVAVLGVAGVDAGGVAVPDLDGRVAEGLAGGAVDGTQDEQERDAGAVLDHVAAEELVVDVVRAFDLLRGQRHAGAGRGGGGLHRVEGAAVGGAAAGGGARSAEDHRAGGAAESQYAAAGEEPGDEGVVGFVVLRSIVCAHDICLSVCAFHGVALPGAPGSGRCRSGWDLPERKQRPGVGCWCVVEPGAGAQPGFGGGVGGFSAGSGLGGDGVEWCCRAAAGLSGGRTVPRSAGSGSSAGGGWCAGDGGPGP